MTSYHRAPQSLVQILRELQAAQGWLTPQSLLDVSVGLGQSLAHVQGVASFYHFFHTRPVGDYRILFSDNITDRMLGSEALLADLCQRLGVAPGQTRPDGRVSISKASCTRHCDQGASIAH